MTVAELAARLSHREYLEWQNFYNWEAKQRKREQDRARRAR